MSFEEKFLPGDLPAAARLLDAYVAYVHMGNTELAHACKRELDRLAAYKKENDRLLALKEDLNARGFGQVVIKIENLHIHGGE
jgi:sulfur transfer complex TusBCD TusB component (DsrH family)